MTSAGDGQVRYANAQSMEHCDRQQVNGRMGGRLPFRRAPSTLPCPLCVCQYVRWLSVMKCATLCSPISNDNRIAQRHDCYYSQACKCECHYQYINEGTMCNKLALALARAKHRREW